MYWSSTSPIKQNNRTAKKGRWETTNSKPPGSIRNAEQQVKSIYYTFLFACVQHCKAFYKPTWNSCNCAEPNPISCGKLACFKLSSSNFNVQDHSNRAPLEVLLSFSSLCRFFVNFVIFQEKNKNCETLKKVSPKFDLGTGKVCNSYIVIYFF
jgi:hypothetical protein